MTPAPMHLEESITSLKFGEMCKKIQNAATVNKIQDDKTLIKKYKLEILKLRSQLAPVAEGGGEVKVMEILLIFSTFIYLSILSFSVPTLYICIIILSSQLFQISHCPHSI